MTVDCLVLGAGGFLGSMAVRALAAQGRSVRAFDTFPHGVPDWRGDGNIETVTGDFGRLDDIIAVVADVRHVLHFISTTTPASSSADPMRDAQTNIPWTVEMLRACVGAGVERVIFPSTGGAIYGRSCDRPLHEDDRVEPVSPYAVGKLSIEGYLRYFTAAHGLDHIVYRISNPYGPGQRLTRGQGVIPAFIERILCNQPVEVIGDGSMVRDYAFVDDVIAMIVGSFDAGHRHHVYNVGSGTGTSVMELVDILRTVSGQSIDVLRLPERPTDTQSVILDVSRFSSEFGISCTTSLTDGIAQTFEYAVATSRAGT